MMATNKAGPELGFARDTPDAVAEALMAGLERNDREVVRASEARLAMIAANRDRPGDVDEQFRAVKARLEEAVAGHRTL
jgi:uncharacterized oxidoreductase